MARERVASRVMSDLESRLANEASQESLLIANIYLRVMIRVVPDSYSLACHRYFYISDSLVTAYTCTSYLGPSSK